MEPATGKAAHSDTLARVGGRLAFHQPLHHQVRGRATIEEGHGHFFIVRHVPAPALILIKARPPTLGHSSGWLRTVRRPRSMRRPMTPPPALLKDYAARDRAYVLS